MITKSTRTAVAVVLLGVSVASAQTPRMDRAPAVPLVTHNPYFSVWSMSDRPTDDWSKHWTGKIQAMCGMVRVDGRPFRILGPEPKAAEAMTMTGCAIWPTRTIYTFEAGGVRVALTFTSPLLPNALDLLTRPVTYATFDVKATDGKAHEVAIYFDASAEWAVNTPDQKVTRSPIHFKTGLDASGLGMAEPKVLGRSGDDLRIEWGAFHVGSPSSHSDTVVGISSDRSARDGFAETGKPGVVDLSLPRAANDQWPVMFQAKHLGNVGEAGASWYVVLAYDEEFAMEYFGTKLRPYWRRNGKAINTLMSEANRDYAAILDRCRKFDEALMADLETVGGKDYAKLCALSYRQCLSAHGFAALPDGKLLMLSKENFSNGCIGTVDVTYPSSPFFLLFNVDMLKAQVTPILDYGQSARWKFPFAPHDLGQYPLANGQVYGGGEKTEKDQMPVEECGNMLLLVAAIARADGNADYAKPYWPLITKWADYLKSKGLDPENQLCTDDFAGHLAHNTNLSLKAICALGGYAQMAETLGKKDEAKVYRDAAKEMAALWVKMADDGDHYRLAFDKLGTWSQKYNLVWDTLLNLKLFPPEVAAREVAFSLKNQKEYGLPLDNRSLYTKLDWIVWVATMAHSREDFEAFIKPIVRFAEKSPSRVPLTDWYWTHDAKQKGFQARSVVGGVFIKMLDGRKDWGSYAPGLTRP